MFEQLGKGLLKQTTSCLLEQLAEKLSSELLCKQIRSNKLCSVSAWVDKFAALFDRLWCRD